MRSAARGRHMGWTAASATTTEGNAAATAKPDADRDRRTSAAARATAARRPRRRPAGDLFIADEVLVSRPLAALAGFGGLLLAARPLLLVFFRLGVLGLLLARRRWFRRQTAGAGGSYRRQAGDERAAARAVEQALRRHGEIAVRIRGEEGLIRRDGIDGDGIVPGQHLATPLEQAAHARRIGCDGIDREIRLERLRRALLDDHLVRLGRLPRAKFVAPRRDRAGGGAAR